MGNEIYVKINVKLQEKTPAKWDMSTHHVPTVSCVNLRSRNFGFNMFLMTFLETIKTN